MKDRLMRVGVRAALTEPLVRVLARKRQGGADTGLDRQVAAVLELERIMKYPALDSMEPARARRYAEAGLSPLDVAIEPMAEVIDTSVAGGIPVRIFVPPDVGPHWIVYFHGGGGVIGSIQASEPATRLIAAQTGCRVASVGYRLGPEARHPAAIEDAIGAFDALAARAGGGKVAVAGDSFGGYLSAHVDHGAKRRPDLQVLIYPMVDLRLISPTIDRFASGYLLTRSMMHWFRGNYLHDTDDRLAGSPVSWTDLRGAAPAIVATAGFDPLVAEGDAWAQRLDQAGVTVRHRPNPSLVHGFLSLAGGVRAARAATDQICTDIVALLK